MENIQEQIDVVLEGIGAIGRVYIGNYAAACNLKTLRKYNIRAVITAATGLTLPHSKQVLPNYLYLPIDDNAEQELVNFFDPTFDFLQKNRLRTNVLIHCFSGISRSAALIMAYMIRRYGYTVVQALTLCKRAKRKINPNKSFIRQLLKYHRQMQTDRARRWKTQRDEIDTNIKNTDDLSKQLLAIKRNSRNIERKIKEAKNKLMQQGTRKSSKSEYLKNVLAEVKLRKITSLCFIEESVNQNIESTNHISHSLNSISDHSS